MTTTIFSPSISPTIIKLTLLLIVTIATAGVTVWLIRKDVKEMAEKADRLGEMRQKADRLGERRRKAEEAPGEPFIAATDKGKPGGDMTAAVTTIKEKDEIGRARLRALSAEYSDTRSVLLEDPFPDSLARTYPVSKNKNKKRGPKKGNNQNHRKGGGAR